MHPRDRDRDGGLVSLRIAASAYPLGARARSHWRARYASISVHESRCDTDGNSWMVREPLVHRNNISGKPRASRRRNSTAMVRPRYCANDAGVARNVLPHCTLGGGSQNRRLPSPETRRLVSQTRTFIQ